MKRAREPARTDTVKPGGPTFEGIPMVEIIPKSKVAPSGGADDDSS